MGKYNEEHFFFHINYMQITCMLTNSLKIKEAGENQTNHFFQWMPMRRKVCIQPLQACVCVCVKENDLPTQHD